MKCKYCAKEIEHLSSHLLECVGADHEKPTYKKSKSMIETVYFHEPASLRDDLFLETDEDVFIVFTADWHVGSDGTDHTALQNDLNFIKKMPNTKMILLGDLIDNFITSAPAGGQHDAFMRPRDQKHFVKEAIAGLADKIIGVVQGCHEEWSFKQDDFDFADFVAGNLNVRNMNFGGIIRYRCGKQEYSLAVAHKYAGGYQNPVGPGKALYGAIGPVDVVVTAHTHRPGKHEFMIQGRIVHVLTCGTYKVEDRHVMRMRLVPSIPSMPAVFLSAKRREIRSWLDFKDALPYLKSLAPVSTGLVPLVNDEMNDASSPKIKEQPSITEQMPNKKPRDGIQETSDDAVRVPPVLEPSTINLRPPEIPVNPATNVINIGKNRSEEKKADTSKPDDGIGVEK